MRSVLFASALGFAFSIAPLVHAQTATVTATCKDGTDFSGATRAGACRGHKGVASWTTATATTTTAPANPGIAPAPAPAVRSANASPSAPPAAVPSSAASGAVNTSRTAAARTGAPGQVWVNSATKIYHCPGDRYYGKTKVGEFMPQSSAQAAGDKPAAGKACAS